MTPAAKWATAFNVLCVRLDNMGDVLMTTPAIRALKISTPGRRITLITSKAGAVLAPFLPDVDETMAYDAAWSKNNASGNRNDYDMIETLRRRCFDAVVIFTVYSQSALPAALMCHLAGIRLALAHSRENPYRLLSHWVKETEPAQTIRHEVQRQLDLVAAIGAACSDIGLSFATRNIDRQSLKAILQAHKVMQTEGWIVVHCGASAASRRYSPQRYARVISSLHASGRQVLLTGSVQEKNIIDGIIKQCTARNHVLNLTGKLNLGELACLIEDASLLISNNTGPVHIAAAVQTPVVDLYALTNMQHTPWRVPHRLLYHDVSCKNCYSSVC
ncbi:MAG TPA: glycosyltransferase family 9 protein, partial [Eoetvoesiella sp.]